MAKEKTRKILFTALLLCSFLSIIFSFQNIDSNLKFDAYGQTSDPSIDHGSNTNSGISSTDTEISNLGGIGSSSSPDPSMENNSTSPLSPGDISTGTGNGTDSITQNDTSSGPGSTVQLPSDLGNAAGNTTRAVPEFPIAILIMIIAISSAIIMYRINATKI